MRVTMLGSGAAGGVPMIGNQWGVCNPKNSKNRRRRASILVEEGDAILLVDTGPDVKSQLLDAGVTRLDGILYTHIHADHTHGIDEIRVLNRLQQSVIDVYGTDNDLNHLSNKFRYIFDSPNIIDGKTTFNKPCLKAIPITHFEEFNVTGMKIIPFAQEHGFINSTGYRFGKIAYTTDAVNLPEESFKVLSGVETWIIGCLQYEPHPSHAHIDRILEWVDRVGPMRAVLTHLSLRIDHQALSDILPDYIMVGFDGLVIESI